MNVCMPTPLTLQLARNLFGQRVKLRLADKIPSDVNEFIIMNEERTWINVMYCYDNGEISARSHGIGFYEDGVFCNRKDGQPIILTAIIE